MAGDLPAGDGQRGSTPPGGGVPGAGQPMDQAAPGRRAQSEGRGEPQRAAQSQSQSQSQPQPQPQPGTEPPQSGAHRDPQAHSQREGSSQSPAHPQREDSSQSPACSRPDQEPPPAGLSGVDDDWDQEASLAAFVAEVEAGRAHGLVDPDDLYYGEPWDSELDLPALDAVPGEERAGAGSDPPLPEVDPPLPELDAGFLPRGRPGAPPGAGRPAPSRSSAGHRSGFASGGAWDTALPGPALAGSADATAGSDREYAGTSDDELIGVLGAWARIESWAAAGRLSAAAELIRRRPATRGERATRGGVPVSWGKFCPDALAASGRRLLVADPAEVDDDLVGDVTEILTWLCARLYGRRVAPRTGPPRRWPRWRPPMPRYQAPAGTIVRGWIVRPGTVPGTGRQFRRDCGARRFAYNWAVTAISESFAAGKETGDYDSAVWSAYRCGSGGTRSRGRLRRGGRKTPRSPTRAGSPMR